VNGAMPRHVVNLVMEALNTRRQALNGARVLVLGVTYKRDVADLRESPALEILSLLRERGAVVSYHDPHAPELAVGENRLMSEPLDCRSLSEKDCALIVTDHTSVDYGAVVANCPLVVDTRNVTRRLAHAAGGARIFRL